MRASSQDQEKKASKRRKTANDKRREARAAARKDQTAEAGTQYRRARAWPRALPC